MTYLFLNTGEGPSGSNWGKYLEIANFTGADVSCLGINLRTTVMRLVVLVNMKNLYHSQLMQQLQMVMFG